MSGASADHSKKREPEELPGEGPWVVKGRSVGDYCTLHTAPECQFVLRARRPHPLSDVAVERADCKPCTECRWHDGDLSTRENGPASSLRDTLADPDFGPEQLGLSPMGEGGR